MANVVFEDDARAEFLAAAAWYRKHNPLAAERFIDEVERATVIVAEVPSRWRPRGDARQYLVHGFPYALVYQFDQRDDLVVIVAVAHLKRRPGYWRER